MSKNKIFSTDDILVLLCNSVTRVLSRATNTNVAYSPMVQKITRTCLRPDIGCFALFDGGFSGLIVINFSATAALEIYRSYMTNMGIPEEELATRHTSDEVGNTLGELMNQIVGDFTGRVSQELQVTINQNQPKMLTINKEVMVSIDTNLDCPQSRRVAFRTAGRAMFYMELAMDKTEFMKIHDFESEEIDPDRILAERATREEPPAPAAPPVDPALLEQLGI